MSELLEAQAATNQAEKGAEESGLNGNPPPDWGNVDKAMAFNAQMTRDALQERLGKEQSSHMS